MLSFLLLRRCFWLFLVNFCFGFEFGKTFWEKVGVEGLEGKLGDEDWLG